MTGNVGILGTGCYLPERVVTNQELAERHQIVGSVADSFLGDFGVQERRVCGPEETSAEMEARAALDALERAGLAPRDVDLVLTGPILRDRPNPSNAGWVCHRIGASKAIGLDVEAACTTLIHQVVVASALIKQGPYKTVVCATGTTWTRVADYTSKDGWLLGDGAAALVLGPVEGDRGILGFHFETIGQHSDSIAIKSCRPKGAPDRPEQMSFRISDDPSALEWHRATAPTLVPNSVRQSAARAGIGLDGIDYFVPHNPNRRLPRIWAEALGLSDRYHVTIEKYGNLSGATVGVNLHEGVRDGRISAGDVVAMAAPGLGFTFGSIIFRL